MSRKRFVDICLGTVLAVLAAPVIAGLACVVAWQFRAWPFFVQRRVNDDDELFTFVKLRTLPPTTAPYALKPAVASLSLPRFMRTVRELHLDELPQLFLVLIGRMSLVGPRPKMPDEHEPVALDYRVTRMKVPQGCTGLWQIGAHRDMLPDQAPEYDLFYVEHASVRLDLWILWRTFGRVLGSTGLVTLDDVPSWARRRGVPPTVRPSVADTTMLRVRAASDQTYEVVS